MQKVHIIGFGIGPEGGNQHHIIGVECDDTDDEHECIEKPPHQGFADAAVTKLDCCENHDEERHGSNPDGCSAVECQPFERSRGILPCRVTEKKCADLPVKHLGTICHGAGIIEGELSGKENRVVHHKHRHKNQGGQGKKASCGTEHG